MIPCGDPGCLGCQDSGTCEHQNPAVRRLRLLQTASDDREREKLQHYRITHPNTAKVTFEPGVMRIGRHSEARRGHVDS